jgi:hypothetical protein
MDARVEEATTRCFKMYLSPRVLTGKEAVMKPPPLGGTAVTMADVAPAKDRAEEYQKMK